MATGQEKKILTFEEVKWPEFDGREVKEVWKYTCTVCDSGPCCGYNG